MGDVLVSRILLPVKDKDSQPDRPFVGKVEVPVNLDLRPFIASTTRGKAIVVYGIPKGGVLPDGSVRGVCSYGIYKASDDIDPIVEVVTGIHREGLIGRWPNVSKKSLTAEQLKLVIGYFRYHGVPIATVLVHPDTLLADRQKRKPVTEHTLFSADAGRLCVSDKFVPGLFAFFAPQDLVGVYHRIGENAGFFLHNVQRGTYLVGNLPHSVD